MKCTARSLLAGTLVAALGWGLSASHAWSWTQQPPLRGSADILQIVEQSALTYKLNSKALKPTDLRLEAPFPTLRMPWVERRGNVAVLNEFKINKASLAAMAEAEKAYRQGLHETSIKGYAKAVRAQPNNFLALSHTGDAYLSLGQIPYALAYFDKAIAANPFAYESHARRAIALVKLEEWEKARVSFATTLAMVPRNRFVLDEISFYQALLKVDIYKQLLTPRVQVLMEGKSPSIHVDKVSTGEAQVWMMYGLCRAVWLAEPGLAGKRKQAAGMKWNSREDSECLGSALEIYDRLRAEGKLVPLADFERLRAIIKAGFLQEFLYYQFGSQVFAQITLFHSPDKFERLRNFIRQFVLVDKASW